VGLSSGTSTGVSQSSFCFDHERASIAFNGQIPKSKTGTAAWNHQDPLKYLGLFPVICRASRLAESTCVSFFTFCFHAEHWLFDYLDVACIELS